MKGITFEGEYVYELSQIFKRKQLAQLDWRLIELSVIIYYTVFLNSEVLTLGEKTNKLAY